MNTVNEKPTAALAVSATPLTPAVPDLGDYDLTDHLLYTETANPINGTPDAIFSLWGAVQNTDRFRRNMQ